MVSSTAGSPTAPASTTSNTLEAALAAGGYRLTRARRAIVELISARAGTFTAADLLADARSRRMDIGRATVFRGLELLAQRGVLERLDLPAGDHAYVPCEPVHHHHVVCSECGRSTEVRDEGLSSALADIERSTGYAIDSHRLELYGRCPRCRATGGIRT